MTKLSRRLKQQKTVRDLAAVLLNQVKCFFVLIMIIFGMLAGCSRVSTPAARATSAVLPQQLQPIAQTTVAQLGKGEYSAVVTRFDGSMQSMLPEPKLKESWEHLISQTGSYQKLTGVSVEQQQGHRKVTVTCQFEKGMVDIQLGFNDAAQITGLYFSNAPSVSGPRGNLTSIPAAQDPTVGESVSALPLQGLTDSAELEAFLDDLFTKQMKDYGIAGLTFSLVKDGQVFFQKGYGVANLETQSPVDPDTTMFRIGSATKLFTWTAVMQLVEQGKLNLDTDINTYLDFKIPDTFPENITLKHLLSHSAGFEEQAYGMMVTSYDQIQPLGQWLATHIPARVRPPGQLAVYSNYGADLAGYIVERVSGMAYADYLKTNIFNPLGMEHTTAHLPLPPALAPKLSSGYRTLQGAVQPAEFVIPATQPDCCISSTAADMSLFMLAHLNGGQLPGGKGKILETATAMQMQTSLWAPDPRLKAFAYGFMEVVLNGQRILYHGGDIPPFHTLVVLIPDQNLGFFVSYNTDTAGGLWSSDLLSFVDHYFPKNKVVPQPSGDFDAQTSRFVGYYRSARGSSTTMEKVKGLLSWAVIKPSQDGTLLWQPAFSPISIPIIEVEPLLFAEPSFGLTSVFMEDGQQNIAYIYDALPAGHPYEKLAWHANPYLHYGLIGVCGVLFISTFLTALAGFVLRLFKKENSVAQPLSRVARSLAFLVAALYLLASVIFLQSTGNGEAVAFGQMETIKVALGTWLVAASLTPPLLVFTVLSWKNRYWRVASRIHYSLVAIASLAFIWFLSYWNLLGFHY